MARNFRTLLGDISPPWLSVPNAYGVRFMRGFMGYLADMLAEAATQAVKAPWVATSTSPDDALPDIGINFNIGQVPGQANADYREWLTDNPGAWTLWGESATGDFADNCFAPFGVAASDCYLFTRNEWSLIPFPNVWSRFYVVLQGTLPWTEATYGGTPWGTWGSGTWGSDATLEEIAGVLDLLWKWKSGHETGHEVILDFYGHVYGAPPVWGSGRTWGGGVVRWPICRRYSDGKSWGDKETYRPLLDRAWGGKIKI